LLTACRSGASYSGRFHCNPVRMLDPLGEDAVDFVYGVGKGGQKSIKDAVTGLWSLTKGLTTDPVGYAAGTVAGFEYLVTNYDVVWEETKTYASEKWSSGDQGKGELIGEGLGMVLTAAISSKGVDKLSNVSKLSRVAKASKLGELSKTAKAARAAEGTRRNVTYYLYQKVSKAGEHLKYGITKNPAARYTAKELAGGRLRILTRGKRKNMLKLERKLHKTLPIGPEEARKAYINIQKAQGLKTPRY
jgi:hypothetical protein